MKKSIMSILALLVLTLTGCEDTTHFGTGFGDRIITMEYNGHSYIIYKGASRGGITHGPTARAKITTLNLTEDEKRRSDR